MVLRHLVGEHQAGAAVGGSAGFEAPQRVENRGRVAAGRRRQDQAGVAGIDDDRDAILVGEIRRQHRQRGFDERQLARVDHRARHVDQEDEIARRDVRRVDAPRLKADERQAMRRVPRTVANRRRDRERLAVARVGVVEGEIVDQLLDPHRVLRRRLSEIQEAADVGVRGRIHVGRKGRQR